MPENVQTDFNMKAEVYKTILTNSSLQSELMQKTGKSFSTIRRWAVQKSEHLENWKILQILKRHTGAESIESLFE